MTAIPLIITTAGRALLPSNGGIAPVSLTQLGLTETAIVPNAAMVALAGEFKRINTVSGAVTATDTISLGVLDESNDTYDLRGIGLYTATGVLFAVAGQAAPLVEKASQSNLALTLDLKFADIDAAELVFGDTNFLLPAATTEVQGLVELATDAETAAKTDTDRAVSPRSLWFAFSAWVAAQFADVWRASNDGSGSGLDADLLDGQQGSYYANIPARLGYTPVNRAGDQMTGNLIFVNTDIAERAIFFRTSAARETYLYGSASGVGLIDNVVGSLWSYGYADNIFRIRGGLAWHSGNDGSGSGLDADLLDGQDGSFYTNIIARLGYTPLNQTAYTAADVLSKLVTVDGAGSGLDADLLDGQQGGYYADIPGRLGYTPVNKGGDTIAANIAFTSPDAASMAALALDAATALEAKSTGAGPAVMTLHRPGYFSAFFGLDTDNRLKLSPRGSGTASEIWHSGNDGSGSGLDADLLDGQDGSFYTNVIARLGYTPLNQTAYTAADILSKLLAVDGAGSGLDADTVHGYVPVQRGGGVGQVDTPVNIGWDGAGLRATAGGVDLGRFVFRDSPGAARAWVYFKYDGFNTTIIKSYNVANVTRSAQGRYTVHLGIDFGSTDYGVIGNATDRNAIDRVAVVSEDSNGNAYIDKTGSRCAITIQDNNNDGWLDPGFCMLSFYG